MGDPVQLDRALGGPGVVPEVPADVQIKEPAPQLPVTQELQMKPPELNKATRKPLPAYMAPKPVDRVSKLKIGEKNTGFMNGANGLRHRQVENAYKHKFMPPPVGKKGSR